MSVFTKIGPIGFIVLLSTFAWILFRIQASEDSRGATALCLIIFARIANPVIDGFSISLASASSFGQLNTVFSFILLSLAFLEVILIRQKKAWGFLDKVILISLFGVGVYHLFWISLLQGFLISSDLLFLIQLSLFIALHPTAYDLRYLPRVSILVLVILFIIAVYRYQNPMYPYWQSDYGISGPYSNSLWTWFGIEERFRGPYQHPNTLGVQVVFLSVLVMSTRRRFRFWGITISYILIALAASRTSLVALTFAVAVTIYFDFNLMAADEANPQLMRKSKLKQTSKKILLKVTTGTILLISVSIFLRTLISQNQSLSGRTEGIIGVFRQTSGNRIFGRGPSRSTITENSIISLLSQYGIVGILLITFAVVGLMLKYRVASNFGKSNMTRIALPLIPASMGESLFGGSYIDMGPLYFMLALIYSRNREIVENTSK
jgi:hypothetical protein